METQNPAEPLSDVDILLIERALQRLTAHYAHAIDLGRAAEVADLFTDDGVWESPERQLNGADAIRAAFAGRAAMDRSSRHVCTTSAFTVEDSHRAAGVTYFTLYRHDGVLDGPAPLAAPAVVGHYEDVFVRGVDGWRFAHRRAVAAFVARSERS